MPARCALLHKELISLKQKKKDILTAISDKEKELADALSIFKHNDFVTDGVKKYQVTRWCYQYGELIFYYGHQIKKDGEPQKAEIRLPDRCELIMPTTTHQAPHAGLF